VKGRRGEVPRSLLGDVFEAIVAAVYLDGGIEHARNLILGILRDHVAGIVKEGVGKRNYKAILQHYAQTEFACQPEYTVLRQFGPLHDRSFEVIAKLVGRRFGKGIGKNKKDAEQSAARITLLALKVNCNKKLT
jgi:ribonuclease-3